MAFLGVISAPAMAAFGSGAIISNGTVELGVNDSGELNFCCGNASVQGNAIVGTRFLAPGGAEYEFTADGCTCEGWGAGSAGLGVFGAENTAAGGNSNTALVSFNSTATTAVSVVNILNGSSTPVLQVTQDYHPSAVTDNAFEDKVTIKNLTSSTVTGVRYRRTMDWDIEPTAFSEFTTIKFPSPPPVNLLQVTDNGFASSNPSTPPGSILYDSGNPPTGTGVTDSGPADHGSNFDFGFGSLGPGASHSFFVYYGGSGNEANALAAVSAVGAETYSLGESNTANGASQGTPATGLFAFSGVGGSTVGNKPGRVSARGTVTSDAAGSVKFSAANNCDAAQSTLPSIVQWGGMKFTKTSVTQSSCFDDPAIPGTPPSGFDSQTGKANGTLQNSAPATLDWKYVDGGAGSSPNDKVTFVVKDAGSNTLLSVSEQTAGPLSGTPGGVWTFGP
jgi:hypothetical protein